MSLIAIFGGRGTPQEAYLQRLKLPYYVVDHEEVDQIVDFRRFKVLIFPSRLGAYARLCLDRMAANAALFRSRMADFLSRGGRILLFPPAELPSDFNVVKIPERIDWLPIAPVTISRRGSSTPAKVRVESATGFTAGIPEEFSARVYVTFELPPDVPKLDVLVAPKGKPILSQVQTGPGIILAASFDLTTLEMPLESELTLKLFERMVTWGLGVPSPAVFFDILSPEIENRFPGLAASFMRRADQALWENRYHDAMDYAFRAFELVMKAASNRPRETLERAINRVFRVGPEHHLCHGIRQSRNASAHGTRLPEEIPIEETECMISSIKFVLRRVLAL